MRTLWGILYLCLLLGFTGTAHANVEAVPGSQVRHGGWTVEAFRDDQSREFSHCSVNAAYRSNDVLFFWFFGDYKLSVSVMRENWGLVVKQQYPAMLQIDQHPPHLVSGIAWAPNIVTATPNDQARIFKEIRRGYFLQIKAENFDEAYPLPGTNTALRYGLQCVEYFMENQEGRGKLKSD